MLLKLASAALFFALPSLALADPIGLYSVEGKNLDGGTYKGSVQVTQTGETYRVVWKIGSDKFVGVGIGLKGNDAGAAKPDNTAISISYISGKAFGVAHFSEQADKSWKGAWSFAGSKKISTEIWTPKAQDSL